MLFCFSSQKKSKQILVYEIENNDLRKELYLLKNKAHDLRNFSTFAAILKILNPQYIAIVVRTVINSHREPSLPNAPGKDKIWEEATPTAATPES